MSEIKKQWYVVRAIGGKEGKVKEYIEALVKEEFGEAAEPLYPRIIKYFQIVESYHFIKFANMPSK